ncbi:MAG: PSP1 C-terminal conserved region-domain-containing protein [Olpidium bornovanus]|uniref:PSP1 C-terminal conserved region-domain-containing protein n=1 Tax=Olpidium bornovanus TaxID=278681 RepID=A0A8H8DJD9_9FUNG|nr:MAG: PSP1 C-terminal conserved region-domain-containing protein [Olpidium bornovanus]
MLQQRQAEAAAVAEMGMSIPGMLAPTQSPVKELHPKGIYRLAQPAEVTMLVNKSQDESKAMLLCQTKVRHKNLPMEVVDAEYQWDRRKLTFYFIAERRIDFRELVRDLFKIYKTRIWMCAVNPNANSAVPGLNSLKH